MTTDICYDLVIVARAVPRVLIIPQMTFTLVISSRAPVTIETVLKQTKGVGL